MITRQLLHFCVVCFLRFVSAADTTADRSKTVTQQSVGKIRHVVALLQGISEKVSSERTEETVLYKEINQYCKARKDRADTSVATHTVAVHVEATKSKHDEDTESSSDSSAESAEEESEDSSAETGAGEASSSDEASADEVAEEEQATAEVSDEEVPEASEASDSSEAVAADEAPLPARAPAPVESPVAVAPVVAKVVAVKATVPVAPAKAEAPVVAEDPEMPATDDEAPLLAPAPAPVETPVVVAPVVAKVVAMKASVPVVPAKVVAPVMAEDPEMSATDDEAPLPAPAAAPVATPVVVAPVVVKVPVVAKVPVTVKASVPVVPATVDAPVQDIEDLLASDDDAPLPAPAPAPVETPVAVPPVVAKVPVVANVPVTVKASVPVAPAKVDAPVEAVEDLLASDDEAPLPAPAPAPVETPVAVPPVVVKVPVAAKASVPGAPAKVDEPVVAEEPAADYNVDDDSLLPAPAPAPVESPVAVAPLVAKVPVTVKAPILVAPAKVDVPVIPEDLDEVPAIDDDDEPLPAPAPAPEESPVAVAPVVAKVPVAVKAPVVVSHDAAKVPVTADIHASMDEAEADAQRVAREMGMKIPQEEQQSQPEEVDPEQLAPPEEVEAVLNAAAPVEEPKQAAVATPVTAQQKEAAAMKQAEAMKEAMADLAGGDEPYPPMKSVPTPIAQAAAVESVPAVVQAVAAKAAPAKVDAEEELKEMKDMLVSDDDNKNTQPQKVQAQPEAVNKAQPQKLEAQPQEVTKTQPQKVQVVTTKVVKASGKTAKAAHVRAMFAHHKKQVKATPVIQKKVKAIPVIKKPVHHKKKVQAAPAVKKLVAPPKPQAVEESVDQEETDAEQELQKMESAVAHSESMLGSNDEMNQPIVAAKEESTEQDDLDGQAKAETQETQQKAQPPAVAVVAKKAQPVAVVNSAPKKVQVQPVAMPKKVHHVATQHVATQKAFPNKGHHVFSPRAAKRKSVSIHGQHLSADGKLMVAPKLQKVVPRVQAVKRKAKVVSQPSMHSVANTKAVKAQVRVASTKQDLFHVHVPKKSEPQHIKVSPEIAQEWASNLPKTKYLLPVGLPVAAEWDQMNNLLNFVPGNDAQPIVAVAPGVDAYKAVAAQAHQIFHMPVVAQPVKPDKEADSVVADSEALESVIDSEESKLQAVARTEQAGKEAQLRRQLKAYVASADTNDDVMPEEKIEDPSGFVDFDAQANSAVSVSGSSPQKPVKVDHVQAVAKAVPVATKTEATIEHFVTVTPVSNIAPASNTLMNSEVGEAEDDVSAAESELSADVSRDAAAAANEPGAQMLHRLSEQAAQATKAQHVPKKAVATKPAAAPVVEEPLSLSSQSEALDDLADIIPSNEKEALALPNIENEALELYNSFGGEPAPLEALGALAVGPTTFLQTSQGKHTPGIPSQGDLDLAWGALSKVAEQTRGAMNMVEHLKKASVTNSKEVLGLFQKGGLSEAEIDKECGWLMDNFSARQQVRAREEEMLQEAHRLLGGAHVLLEHRKRDHQGSRLRGMR